MKRTLLCLMVALCMLVASTACAYYDYVQHLPIEAGFETLEEARVNGPIALMEARGGVYIADPALDTYPEGTAYVYHSAGLYTNNTAAYRMNTSILVYTDEAFESKDAAQQYLADLGLIDIIDQATGSIVLVTPENPAAGFGAADQYNYLKLQSATCNLGGGERGPDGTKSYADNIYFGGLTYRYAIGIGGGASFLCDYVANTLDYVGRLAGMLLINGDMHRALDVATVIPTYLVNANEQTIGKFVAANGAYATDETPDAITYFNQNAPFRKVVVAKDGSKALGEYVKDAYYNLLVKTMRTPVVKGGLYVAANEFASYSWNQAPYTLTERNAVIDGVTADGIYVVEHMEDRFIEYQAAEDVYLRTWYEFLPEEVLNNTAAEHSIPLFLANHGGGDDPVQAVDELGLITLAGTERFAVVAARYHSDVPGSSIFPPTPFDVNNKILPALVRYMLETYPALDPSRVYATGYSMGGAATICAVEAAPELFAAAVPMAAGTPWGIYEPTEEEIAKLNQYGVAMLFTTSEFDLPSAIDQGAMTIGDGYKDFFKRFCLYNDMADFEYDFEAYPFVGIPADHIVKTMVNDEYENTTWTFNNVDGKPVMGISYTELLPHGLHPDYGKIAWNFVKHYSRDQETGEVVYNAYVK